MHICPGMMMGKEKQVSKKDACGGFDEQID